MKSHISSLLVLGLLLISTSARPLNGTNSDDQIEELKTRRYQDATSFDLLPRAIKLPGIKSPAAKPPPASKPPASKPPVSNPPPKSDPKPVPAPVAPPVVPPATPPKGTPVKPVSSKTGVTTSASLKSSATSSTTGTVSGTKSATTSSASSTDSPAPRKCTKEGCSGLKCKGKRDEDDSTAILGLNTTLTKRVFTTLGRASDVDKLGRQRGSKDISHFVSRESGFIPFGNTKQAVTITGLEGCTVMGVFSPQGMMIFHLFEAAHGNQADTLHPRFMQNTINDVRDTLARNIAHLQGAHAFLMLPLNPAQPGTIKYETEFCNDVNRAGFIDLRLRKIVGTGTVFAMEKMLRETIGIPPQVQVPKFTYLPPVSDAEADHLDAIDSIRGTFAIQYDPRNPVGRAVQVFIEGRPALNPAVVIN